MSRFQARWYLGAMMWAVTLTFAVALLGYFPAVKLGGPEAIRSLVAGCSISLLASAVGALPIALSGGAPSAFTVLAPVALRFVVALGLALVAVLVGSFEPAPLLLAGAASDLVLLIVDTGYALRATRSVTSRPEASEPSSRSTS